MSHPRRGLARDAQGGSPERKLWLSGTVVLGLLALWSPVLTAQESETEMVEAVRAAIDATWESPLLDPPMSCTGQTLYDCFGGEVVCTVSDDRLCSRGYLLVERRNVLAILEEAGKAYPQNGWIMGRWVDHAVGLRDFESAWNAARSCVGTLWWCQALRGYALHHLNDPASELAFDSALVSVPLDEPAWVEPPSRRMDQRSLRCEWSDLSALLEGRLLERYAEGTCGEREAFETRFWWLADPLWSAPGNERRAEHLSRLVQMRLHDEAAGRERGVHTRVHHDDVMKAGPPNSWRVVIEHDGAELPNQTRQAYVNGGYGFVPDADRFLDPMASDEEDWMPGSGEGTERMVTSEEWLSIADHQEVVLIRGDSLSFLSAALLPRILDDPHAVQVALAVADPESLDIEVADATVSSTGVVRASLTVHSTDWLTSLEMVGADWRARSRHGAPAPELRAGFGVSAPVLVDEESSRTSPLTGVMRPSRTIRGGSVGVYFEVYGLDEGESTDLAITLDPEDSGSLLGRLGNALGFGSDHSVSVEWTESANPHQEPLAVQVSLDLSGLDPGPYRLSVDVGRGDGTSASAASRIIIAG